MLDCNQIVLASNNQGKLAEFQQLFDNENLNINIIPQGKLNIDDAIENGLSFVENALIKARHASKISNLPAIADDSGLCVPILEGKPGIYSARFAKDDPTFATKFLQNKDKANNQKLLNDLQKFRPKLQDTPIIGQFVCVLVLVRHAFDPLPVIAQGVWQGEILSAEIGESGFGYDPLFWLPNLQKSSAQLTKTEKNQISHRGQALQNLLAQLKSTH
ncbi:dITP/XTP pyrophosphatase [Moraxella macacae 0408225]|uniref:dITP/XTP pyrophosphatase n=1 Tax=Moraxella macacae 0408225 TaxID=1230338 RepID=L2F7V0_9GAMM|nr:RdgB/HAM1 family non-canonical purine NTP pyrophosphatase [Moraxella macacae]ELA09097.1 dITP/XTP pyrophosphatase [Moraxella macacae 0408225]